MKVLHIFERMTIGGAETLLLNIVKNNKDCSIKYDFLVHSDIPGEYDNILKEYGCEIHILNVKSLTPIIFFKTLLKLFKEYDIIHCHVRKYALLELPIAKHLKLPVILHCHSASSQNSIYNNGIINFFYKNYLNLFVDFAFTCSMEAKKFLFLKNKYAINIVNGIDHNKFKFSKENRLNLRKKYNINDDEVVIGHVGSFRKVKNHQFFIHVAKKMIARDIKFKFILIGDGILKNEFEQILIDNNLDNYFILVGNSYDIPNYLSAFDIFLFPSLFEGLPLSVIEAQVNGLTVLCSENVDKAVKMSDKFYWINIADTDENITKIVDLIINNKNTDRFFESSKFNIADTVSFLTYFYHNCI